MNALTVGSLFAGIGGFDLGLERAGMRTLWFCEQDPFCRRVLGKHWPGVPVHPDVRALVADSGGAGRREDVRGAHGDEGADEGRTAEHAHEPDGGGEGAGERPVLPVPVPYVDILCGGFPCQDISVAGRGEGIDGARSGLWGEYARLIRELRPRYVVVENVAALLARGMERVLGDLAACGYDAEWDCIPASAVGAPHRRDRVWLVAYAQQPGLEGLGSDAGRSEVSEPRDGRTLGEPEGDRRGARWAGRPDPAGPGQREPVRALQDVADADVRPDVASVSQPVQRSVPGGAQGGGNRDPWAVESDMGLLADGLPVRLVGHWDVEPDIGRVAVGVPERVHKLRALGNALVPQIAELIGRRIVAYEEGRLAA